LRWIRSDWESDGGAEDRSDRAFFRIEAGGDESRPVDVLRRLEGEKALVLGRWEMRLGGGLWWLKYEGAGVGRERKGKLGVVGKGAVRERNSPVRAAFRNCGMNGGSPSGKQRLEKEGSEAGAEGGRGEMGWRVGDGVRDEMVGLEGAEEFGLR
jgi:hypothetical protein